MPHLVRLIFNRIPPVAYILLLYAWTSSIPYIFAQNWRPLNLHFASEDGLPTNCIYNIMQDSRGFLWLATEKGPVRFDGLNFKTFPTHQEAVFNLYEDHQGRIWFIGFDIQYEEKGVIRKPPQYDQIRDTIKGLVPSHFAVDSLNQIWFSLPLNNSANPESLIKMPFPHPKLSLLFGSNEDSVFTYSPKKLQQVRMFRLPDSPIHGTNSGATYFTYTWQGNPFVAGTAPYISRDNAYLASLIPKLPRYERYFSELLLFPPKHYFIARDSSEWIISQAEILHLKGDSVLQYIPPQLGRNYLSAYLDRSENLWLGTRNGIWFWPKGKKQALIKLDFLPDHSVTAITQDQLGCYWMSTIENGIYALRSKDLLQLISPSKVGGNSITQLVRFKEKLWWVTQQAKLYAGKPNSPPALVHYFKDQNPPNIGTVHDSLLITSYNWSFLDEKHPIPPPKTSKYVPWFRQIVPSKRGTIWMAAWGGFFEFDQQRQEMKWRSIHFGVRENSDAICFDPFGNLWVGGRENLLKVRGDSITKTATQYPLVHQKNGKIKRLAVWQSDFLIVVKKGVGLFQLGINPRLSPSEKVIDAAFTTEINDFFLEGDSLLWLSTDDGIQLLAYDPPQTRWISRGFLNQGDGMRSEVVSSITRIGKQYAAATGKGLIVFNKGHVFNPKSNSIRLCLLELQSSDTTILSPATNIELAAGTKQFVLRYMGINFRLPHSLAYRYRLLGLDSSWQYTQVQSIQYTNIPPGDYQFELQARNKETEWTPPIYYTIKLRPLFTQTLAFTILVILLIAGASFLVALFILKTISRRQRMERRMNQLSYQALQSQMNPHFMFNAMNSILYLITTDQRKAAGKYLTSLARLIRRVLEDAEDPFISLMDEVERSRQYLELEQLQFGDKLNIHVKVDNSVADHRVLVPKMLIQPFLENAIKHGIGPQGYGLIKLTICKQDRYLSIVVEDNGVGREAASLIKSEDALTRTKRLGISNTSDRIQIINRLFDLDIQLRILDLSNGTKGVGTRVEILIPHITQHPQHEYRTNR